MCRSACIVQCRSDGQAKIQIAPVTIVMGEKCRGQKLYFFVDLLIFMINVYEYCSKVRRRSACFSLATALQVQFSYGTAGSVELRHCSFSVAT